MAERQVIVLGQLSPAPWALAESYVTGSAREAGAAAELAASRKEEKYATIGSQYLFAPIAVETLGPLNMSACQLFGNLGRKVSSSSGDDRGRSFSVPKSFGASAALQRCLVT